jgi:hypothetical protein
LSTTADCWKKSCQGVTVVPMLARITNSSAAVNPPGISGRQKPSSTLFQPGAPGAFIAHRAAGMYTRLKTQKNRVSFSKVQ